MTPNLDKLFAEATQGPHKDYILALPLSAVPAYVQGCIDASGGDDFLFISAPHPETPESKSVDVAHVGNGPRGQANARKLALLATHGRTLIEALEDILVADAIGHDRPFQGALQRADQLLATLEREAKGQP